MTKQEAKTVLEIEIRHHPEWSIFHEALSEAVSALEEIQQYRAIGTVEELREAAEKQRTKKMKGRCPDCGTPIKRCYFNCPGCGQSIDWSEEE